MKPNLSAVLIGFTLLYYFADRFSDDYLFIFIFQSWFL